MLHFNCDPGPTPHTTCCCNVFGCMFTVFSKYDCLIVCQQEDGETFRGFIRVTMNLTRPVSVGAEEKEKERKKVQRSDSFYVNKVARPHPSTNRTPLMLIAHFLAIRVG